MRSTGTSTPCFRVAKSSWTITNTLVVRVMAATSSVAFPSTSCNRAQPPTRTKLTGRIPMDFGVVLQTNPPASRTVALAKLAEQYGFSHLWTFDSHLLWQEPYVIYSRILAETNRIMVGPMVTNPAT